MVWSEIAPWLEMTAKISLGLGFLTAVIILIDVIRHPQMMLIMNIVWPITGLYFPVVGLWFYWKIGRPKAKNIKHEKNKDQPFWKSIFLSTTHCASGCVIGDVIGPPLVFVFGWAIFGEKLFADYVAEFVLAYILGIAFQYFPIMSKQNLSAREGIRHAIKADTWSLVAFEVGMLGFITSYPANWWLVKTGVKAEM